MFFGSVISILIPPNLDLMNIETIIQSIPASSIADVINARNVTKKEPFDVLFVFGPSGNLTQPWKFAIF